MTADISRHFADPDKQFRAVAHQQGRLPTDAEANHAEAIDTWQAEAQFRETIAELGSPDQGFRLAPIPGDGSDFEVLGGSMYADGVRLFNPVTSGHADQAIGNWLTMTPADRADPDSRLFAWLEAEQRLVTAVEDSELLDPALRGADGAARTRICWRVRQIETDEDECLEALAEALGPDVFALYDAEFGAIRPSGTLTVGFTTSGTDLDLCVPTVSGGYFGDRNATYRVKITGDGRLVWGEDNASLLFRVQLGPANGQITFLTHPRDEWQRPKTGMTVELLRGDVLLGNLEKIAEPDGALLRVTGSYDGSTITVNPADVPAGWAAWLAGLDGALFAPGTARFFYLRVWTGGGTAAPGAPDLAYTPGTALPLGGSGLTVTIAGDVLPGDSWTFSARPDAPQQVLPWQMLRGMPPHGPRRFAMPLGFIDLDTGDRHDCRQRFSALQKIRSCCTITVGDGVESRGDTDSIAEAIEMLPDEGGEICLLRGTHVASITLMGARNIHFSGCETRAVWQPADPDEPALMLLDCTSIAVHGIRFEAGAVPALIATASDPYAPDSEVGGLAIEDCAFNAPQGFALSVRDHNGMRLLRNTIKAGPFPQPPGDGVTSGSPAVFVHGERLLVERCTIDATIPRGTNVAQRALGGIQVGGGSSAVAIRQCTITEGTGTGIVLGSIIYEEADGPAEVDEDRFDRGDDIVGAAVAQSHRSAFLVFQSLAGCLTLGVVPGNGTGPDDTPGMIPVSEGEITDVLIEGNTIFGMGANGIGTYPLGLFGAGQDPAADAIAVERLEVSSNRIVDCRRLEIPDFASQPLDQLYMPFGGVALAMVSHGLFRENHIEGCGTNDGSAICGIGVTYGEMLRFEDNLIFGNGRHDPAVAPIGPNSALEVRFATGGLPTFTLAAGGPRGPDKPALSIQNNLLDAPAGRAIRALALGPVRVSDNRLIGGNPSRLLTNLLGSVTGLFALFRALPQNMKVLGILDAVFDLVGGDCVNITNIGIAEDFAAMLVARIFKQEDSTPEAPPPPTEDPMGPTQATAATTKGLSFADSFRIGLINAGVNASYRHPLQGGGDILFANNQTALRAPSTLQDAKGSVDGKSAMSATSMNEIYRGGLSHEAPAAGAAGTSEEAVLSMAGIAGMRGTSATQAIDFGRAGLGTICAIFLASLDDIYFGDNQCEVESERLLSIFHAVVLGLTLRIDANRMQEGAISFRSILGYGLRMHNAVSNQTTASSLFLPAGTTTQAHLNQSVY